MRHRGDRCSDEAVSPRPETPASKTPREAKPVSSSCAKPAEGRIQTPHARAAPEKVSDQIEHWLAAEGEKTLGGLIDVFQEKSFALVFILLLGVPALPLPTGGATHVFEIISILVALQLVVGRDRIWLPERWRKVELGSGGGRTRFLKGLTKVIRGIERFSRPRLRFLFAHRASNTVFGLLPIAGSLGAFLAPPFTGLDTLPALGVVLLSLGVLMEDFAVVVLAVIVGVAGVVLELVGRILSKTAPVARSAYTSNRGPGRQEGSLQGPAAQKAGASSTAHSLVVS